MVSLRFPYGFAQWLGSNKPHHPSSFSFPHAPILLAATAGIGFALAFSPNFSSATGDSSARPSASLAFSESSTTTVVEPRTGVVFPCVVDGARRLLGIGLRRRCVFGLKNIDVYAFGVYADVSDVKKMGYKHGLFSEFEACKSKELIANVLDQDLRMTVRLQIVFGRLTVGSARSAFEESVGCRLKKLSGSENKDLLRRFTSLFKDEYKLPPGSVIDLSREQGYVLQIKIDGKEVGNIQNKMLCQSILDLYIGDDPLDAKARDEIELVLTSLIQN